VREPGRTAGPSTALRFGSTAGRDWRDDNFVLKLDHLARKINEVTASPTAGRGSRMTILWEFDEKHLKFHEQHPNGVRDYGTKVMASYRPFNALLICLIHERFFWAIASAASRQFSFFELDWGVE
jgi:hypothetical protein